MADRRAISRSETPSTHDSIMKFFSSQCPIFFRARSSRDGWKSLRIPSLHIAQGRVCCYQLLQGRFRPVHASEVRSKVLSPRRGGGIPGPPRCSKPHPRPARIAETRRTRQSFRRATPATPGNLNNRQPAIGQLPAQVPESARSPHSPAYPPIEW